jgi:hypothetical protein
LPSIATISDGVRSSAVYGGDFDKEGGERGTELVSGLDAVY